MNKLFTIVFVVLGIYSASAQITLEHTYNVPNSNYDGTVKIQNDAKYLFISFVSNNFTIHLFNADHSIFKTIPIPAAPVNGAQVDHIFALSDSLFTTDGKVAYGVQFSRYDSATFSYVSSIAIFDENGASLFFGDSLNDAYHYFSSSLYFYSINGATIVNTSTGTKMVLQKVASTGVAVFSLPGRFTGMKAPSIQNNTGTLNAYPNPSGNQTILKYELPDNVTAGEIVLYNTSGQELKRYQVDSTFDNLLLDNSQLPSGNYLYQLITTQGVSGAKKVVVIK